MIVRQSTARTIMVGPVLDADGVAVTDSVVADFLISKNGAAPGALDGSATLTHRHTGHYSLALTATDLNTVGSAQVTCSDTVNACGEKDLTVIEEAVYDAFYAASATGLPAITTDWLGAAGIAAAAANKIADHCRRRTQANVEASSDGDAVSLGSEYGNIQLQQQSDAEATPGSLEIYKVDGTTVLGTKTLNTDAAAVPVTGIS